MRTEKTVKWWTVAIATALCIAEAFGAQTLPPGYTRLRKIQTSGAQWINTEYTPALTDRIEMKIYPRTCNDTKPLFCSRAQTADGTLAGNQFAAFLIGNGWRFDLGSRQVNWGTASSATTYTVVVDGSIAAGATEGSATSPAELEVVTGDAGSPLVLFGSHEYGASLADDSAMTSLANDIILFSVRVYDKDGRLKFDGVPARDDNAPNAVVKYGVYDLVRGKFHKNNGTASFADAATGDVEDAAIRSPFRSISIEEAFPGDGVLNVRVAFDNPGTEQRLFLAMGASDGGDTTNDWDSVVACGTVGSYERARIESVPGTARFYRFFMEPALTGGYVTEYVHSTGEGQYVDTDFRPTILSSARIRFDMDSNQPSGGPYYAPFGTREGGSKQFWNFYGYSTWTYRLGGGERTLSGRSTGEHEQSSCRKRFWADGSFASGEINASDFTATHAVSVFGVNDTGSVGKFMAMKLYAFSLYDRVSFSRAYVPFVTAEGEPALYDMVNGNADAKNACATVGLDAGERYFASTPSAEIALDVAQVACWTGAGDVADLTDANNWACTNAIGVALAGAIPTAGVTMAHVNGQVGFDVATSEAVIWKELLLGDVVLTKDCDWRGMGPGAPLSGHVELFGHSLAVAGLSGEATLSASDGDLTSPASAAAGATLYPRLFNDVFHYTAAPNRINFPKNSQPSIDYDFGCAVTVDYYTLTAGAPSGTAAARAPQEWQLLASDDAINWTPLDSRKAQQSWKDGEKRTYPIGTPRSFRYYRVSIVKNNGDGDVIEFVQLEYCRRGFGELHVDVPSGALSVNEAIALTGGLKLVKEGAGKLVARKDGQDYGGTTEVVAGTLTCDADPAAHPFGGNSDDVFVTVDAAGTFDINGKTGFEGYRIVLDGGTVSGASLKPNFILTLTDDSQFVATGDIGTDDADLANAFPKTDLGGHKLGLTISSGNGVYLKNVMTNGVLEVLSGGRLCVVNNAVDMSTVDLVMRNAALVLESPLDVRGYCADCLDDLDMGSALLNVHGTFKPNTEAFYGCTLLDGASINLAERTAVWNTTSVATRAKNTVEFADNAKIVLMPGEWATGGIERQLVSWNAVPANLRTLRFSLPPECRQRHLRLKVDQSGIWIAQYGMAVIIR